MPNLVRQANDAGPVGKKVSRASANTEHATTAWSMESLSGSPQNRHGEVTSLCSLAEVRQPLSQVLTASILTPWAVACAEASSSELQTVIL